MNSAKQLLHEATCKPSVSVKNVGTVEEVPLHEEEGFTAISFVLPEILAKWGGKIREIQVDSACKVDSFLVYMLLNCIISSNKWLRVRGLHGSRRAV